MSTPGNMGWRLIGSAMGCARLARVGNVLPLRDTSRQVPRSTCQCAEAIVLEFEDPVWMAKQLAQAPKEHWFDNRKDHCFQYRDMVKRIRTRTAQCARLPISWRSYQVL